MYKAVILDLDGTLLNTLDDLSASVNFALKSMNYPTRTIDEVRNFIGNGVVVLMQRAVPTGTDEESSKKALEIFRAHYLENMDANTQAYDGVIDMLKIFKKDGIKTAVVSNKLHEAVTELCEDYFGDLIELPLGVSNEDERKPKPTNVFKAMQVLGEDENSTVYVGDSEVDIQTAKNANLKCIAVTWGFRDKVQLEESKPEFIADNTDEVLKIVQQ